MSDDATALNERGYAFTFHCLKTDHRYLADEGALDKKGRKSMAKRFQSRVAMVSVVDQPF